LARAFPHPRFEFEEHVHALCLQVWPLFSGAGLTGIDGVSASAAIDASVFEIQSAASAAAIGAGEHWARAIISSEACPDPMHRDDLAVASVMRDFDGG
jgi:hypothetical protein